MTNILLLCDRDDELEQELIRALVVPLPDFTITTVHDTQAAIGRMGKREYDAVLVYRPTNNVDSVLLMLAATRSSPGRTILSMAGGPRADRIEFQMIVRMRDPARGVLTPFPAEQVAHVLTSLVHGESLVPEEVG